MNAPYKILKWSTLSNGSISQKSPFQGVTQEKKIHAKSL